MSSKPISEASAKAVLRHNITASHFQPNDFRLVTPIGGVDAIDNFSKYSKLVAKPDLLIKRRGKLGLISVGHGIDETKVWISDRLSKPLNIGNTTGVLDRFLVEPFIPHDESEEYYVCIYTTRQENVILFYHQGGVEIGDVDSKARKFHISIRDMMHCEQASEPTCSTKRLLDSQLLDAIQDPMRKGVLAEFIVDLLRVFDQLHFTYLEINPLVVCRWPDVSEQSPLRVHVLDVAAKVDQCAEFIFASNPNWFPLHMPAFEFPMPFGRVETKEENYIAQLDARTGASMKLSILNPNGRIWTMSAGGGASVIYADTVCELAEKLLSEQGKGQGAADLANYGEYSGAPSEGQTYDYAKTILSLMTHGDPHPEGKILLIGGGIANFTNVAATFKGIVRALTDYQDALRKHRITIFVRRAGPNYQEGLRIMRELGSTLDIPIHVFGPETHMTAIVSMAFGLRPIQLPSQHRVSSHPTDYLNSPTTPILISNGNSKSLTNGYQAPPSLTVVDSDWSDLFHEKTRCIVWGLQAKAIQSMLDFDYASGRDSPSVAAIVYPFGDTRQLKVYWGSKEIFLPVFKEIRSASFAHPDADVLVNFGSLRVAYDVSMEAMSINTSGANEPFCTITPTTPKQGCRLSAYGNAQFKCIAIIAEGIPERLTRRLICRADDLGVLIIGPATVGGIKPGCFKIGNTGGMVDNILAARLHRPGSVAYVSRSGGMSNELNNIISLNSDGVQEGVAIGGDRYPGSTFLDHILRYEANPQVGMIVMLGEVGGSEEYRVAEAVQSGRVTKPIVCWCIGTCAQLLASHASSDAIQFGHAGACANSAAETATAKNAALATAGLHVPSSFDQLDTMIREVFTDLVISGKLQPKPDRDARPVPLDYSWAKELGLIRRPAAFTSTICDDRGAELLFAGVPITQVISEDFGIGGVLGLLWFKRRLPEYAGKFLELCLIITADHGPAVSGALNTIVTARAGKDLLSSLTSGLLTIGDRFGGALDGAARQFSSAFDNNLKPAEFVANERRASRLIMGIGHRVKSITNPDMRVQLLRNYVCEHFPAHPLVDYAFEVEKITTSKRPNLILNVDGIIGVAMVDMLRHCGRFTREEADEYMTIGTLNGLFVLGRSIGFIGHYLDQKRLHQGLYRHPWEDISYLLPEADTNGYQ